MTKLPRRLGSLLFFVLPFVLLSWALPFAPFAVTLGKDYTDYTPSAQLNFMWAVWHGTLPVYMPGFVYGHSTAAMTLGQLYHPMTWLASAMPGYWSGRALEWETTLRLLSLGGAHLALFRLFRRVRVPAVVAFLATLPAVYNLRMLDSFRYGASLENYVGMLLVIASVGFVFVERRRRWPVAALAASTYLLLVGGHPQWAFLGFLGAGVFSLAAPWALTSLTVRRAELTRDRVLRYLARVTLGFASGILLAGPYLLPFYMEFLRTNATRAEGGYEFTLKYGDSTLGELANFVFPLHADVHGAFGGSALFLVVALVPLLVVVTRVPRGIFALLAFASGGFLFALGDSTPLHALIVHDVPLFGSFRVPGRAVLWIIPAVAPAIAWLGKPTNRRALGAVSGLAAVVVVLAGVFRAVVLPDAEAYSPLMILKLASTVEGLDAALILLALATVILLGLAGALPRFRTYLFAGAAAAALASTSVCLSKGTWKHPKITTPSLAALGARWKASPYAQSKPGFGMENRSVTAYRAAGLHVPVRFGAIAHDLARSTSDEATLDALASHDGRVFVDALPSEAPPTEHASAPRDSVDLRYNTTNRFVFDVKTATPGEVLLGLPWLPGFQAEVDGHDAPVTRANAIFPAVAVAAGAHRVELRFVSWPFLTGVAVGTLTALAWLFAALRVRLVGAIVTSVLVLGAEGVVLDRWLYQGPSFDTQYHWEPGMRADEHATPDTATPAPAPAADEPPMGP